jgi:2,3-bisphosphoglycerate-dependent phosphoglycerate mutase
MPIVWLIRHGQSQANAGYETYSPELTQLTTVGEVQAGEIVKALHSDFPKPSRIVYSKFMRSRQTAQPTIDFFFDVPSEKWPGVREFTYLAQEKCQATTRQQRKPFVDGFWNIPDPDYRDGNDEEVESFRQFLTRVSSALEQLCSRKDDLVVVFTHGQFMQAAKWLWEAHPTHLDEQSKANFRLFCTNNRIPMGAIMPIEILGRDELVVQEMLSSHLSKIITSESGEDLEEDSCELQEEIPIAAH